MFERFTDRARRVVVLAQEEARMLNHNYIGTEHFLLGLAHEGEGIACQALEALGISLDTVRAQVHEVIGEGAEPAGGHIPFTPRAKKVLDLSLREALQLSHRYIGTEHILLGIIREGEGVAAQILVKLGADLNTVRQQVIELIARRPGETTPRLPAEATPWVGAPRTATVRTPPDPDRMPLCPGCRESLTGSLKYRVLEMTEHEGDGVGKMLVAYCTSCGLTIDSAILPEAP